MVVLSNPLPASLDRLSLYSVKDAQLNCPVFVFYGPSALVKNSVSASRVQVHIFSPAGFRSYSRLTVSPESPHHAAVAHLPYDLQGDELYRALALALLRYFSEIPKIVLAQLTQRGGPKMFDEMHAGDLAGQMRICEQKDEVLAKLQGSFAPKHCSHIDVDLVLPPRSLSSSNAPAIGSADCAEFLDMFGPSEFLPTSRIRRAPSKVNSLNRSNSLLKQHQDVIGQEIDQLIQTEASYVTKLVDLLHGLIKDIRRQTIVPADGNHQFQNPLLEQLFPSSLDSILEANCKFLDQLQRLPRNSPDDPCGVSGLCNVFELAVVSFREPYRHYMQINQGLPQLLQSLRSGPPTAASAAITSYGVQRLRSILIEPVQRLPRYTMYLDNVTKELHRAHPALNRLLRVKDSLVDICALDSASQQSSDQTVAHLRSMTKGWPSQFNPRGRLIAAIDATDLPSLYDVQPDAFCGLYIVLLFRDALVMLNKHVHSDATAHGFMTELDKKVSGATAATTLPVDSMNQEPLFAGWTPLNEMRLKESADGRIAYMTLLGDMRDVRMHFGRNSGSNHNGPGTRALLLQGPYEGRANRFSEDLTKARLEGRYSEEEREAAQWDLRRVQVAGSDLSLWTAATEELITTQPPKRGQPASLRVVYNGSDDERSVPVGSQGIEIIVNITRISVGRFRIRIESLGNVAFEEDTSVDIMMSTLAARLSSLLLQNNQIENPILSIASIADYTNILQSLVKSRPEASPTRSKISRPASPVKLLSNMLGSALGSHSPTKESRQQSRSPTKNIPRLLPARSLPERPVIPGRSLAEAAADKEQHVSVVRLNNSLPRSETFARLEETLRTFAIAISDRADEVTGVSVRGRKTADEAAVNALYNTSVDSMADQQNMWEVPVSVLFAGLEKFLKHAWAEQMGSVVTAQFLDSLQDCCAHGGDFEENFKARRENLTPQNSRAFEALVKLLAVLLQMSSNDGDRGSLTFAFAEILVMDADPYQYVGLFDRLVEDAISLFAEPATMTTSTPFTTSLASSVTSRSTYATTGSINSKASSFRSRFASMLGKDSSKDPDSRSGGVFRALSKHSHKASASIASGMSMPISPSKVSLVRSKSSDAHSSLAGFLGRPHSKDQNSIAEESVVETTPSRPTSSHRPTSKPSSIRSRIDALSKSPGGAGLMAPPPLRPKAKRRSSLSDLPKLDGDSRPSSSSSKLAAPSPLVASLQLKDPGSPFRFSTSKTSTPVRTLTRPLPSTPLYIRPSSHHGISPTPFDTSFRPLEPKRPSSSDSPSKEVARSMENQPPRTPSQLKTIPRLTPAKKASPVQTTQASPLGERSLNRMTDAEVKRHASSSKENPAFSSSGTVTSPSGIPTPRTPGRLSAVGSPQSANTRTKGSLKIPAAFSAANTAPKLPQVHANSGPARPVGSIMDRQRPVKPADNDLTATLNRLQLQRPDRSITKPTSPSKFGSTVTKSLLPSPLSPLPKSQPNSRPSSKDEAAKTPLILKGSRADPAQSFLIDPSPMKPRDTLPIMSPATPLKPSTALQSTAKPDATASKTPAATPRKITPPLSSLTAKEKDARIISAESRLKAVEKHLRESQTENLLLYERFNTELQKLAQGCNGGEDGKEDVSAMWVAKIKGLGDELGKVRKENVKLKREVVSLRGKVAVCEKSHHVASPNAES